MNAAATTTKPAPSAEFIRPKYSLRVVVMYCSPDLLAFWITRELSRSAVCDQSSRMLCRRFSARSEEHTSELQSLMRNSYAVFCLKKKTQTMYTWGYTHQERQT